MMVTLGDVSIILGVMDTAIVSRICEIDVRIGEAWTRMPFRYGNACLTAVPLVHIATTVEARGGRVARGVGADCLPPRWFDKDPGRDFRRNVDDQLAAINAARRVYVECGRTATASYSLWRAAYPGVLEACGELGLNKLTASFGSSLVERSLIDATCRLAGVSFFEALHEGLLGYQSGPELPATPRASIAARHTVGLGDFIRDDDIPDEERLDDGLPQSLEAAVRAYGLRYFKVKVSGDSAHDLERLGRIAELLASVCPDRVWISLDGNEQYRDLGVLEELIEGLRRTEAGARFVESIVFIEQPLARELALEDDVRPAVERLGRLRPVIIDESDDDLNAFPRATELGYRGCSVKNCKGVFKALSFCRHAHRLNEQCGERRYFQTGEDLANLAVVPLQQDLTTLAVVGVTHAERNGHHYFRGLAHLPVRERDSAARTHPDIYTVRDGLPHVRIEDGRIECGSLHAPGYGYSCELALDERVPVEEWRFERLGLSES